MNPPCAKCNKTVYPMEKMSVLDKCWHTGCFRCEVCDLKLTLKTYKGYSKKPYCSTHYPTTKFTAVADTPENIRLAKQTQNQSKVIYQKQFQEEKGHRTASNVSYGEQATAGYDQPPPPRQPIPAHVPDTRYQQPVHVPDTRYQPPAHVPDPSPSYNQPLPSIVQQPLPPVPTPAAQGPRYQALYDYSAADDDEVSFNEGDLIIEVTIIDDGWMEGRVQRSNQYGMLPSNYVEKI